MESILPAPQIQVSINNQPLDARALADLSSFTVEHGSGLTSKFTLVLRTWNPNTRKYTWVDAPLFKLGGKVEIKMGAGKSRPELLLLGEITDLELKTEAGGPPVLEVSGLDPRHVLAREQKTRRFNEKTLAALVRRIAGAQGFKVGDVPVADIAPVTQYNQTDLEFLNVLARDHGCELVLSLGGGQKTLHLLKREAGAPSRLTLGKELLEFNPRISSQALVGKVTVRSASPNGEKELVESARLQVASKRTGLLVGEPREKGQRTITNRPVNSPGQARALAQAELERLVSSAVTGSGLCFGDPSLSVGETLDIQGVGERFSGEYHLTQVTHTFSTEQGFRTAFEVQGGPKVPDSVGEPRSVMQGLAVARVNQVDAQGRVTLLFPWLAPDYVSDWVRVASPMAGKGHGLYLPLQVDDEVLVAFEQGDIDRPFVLGGVWNASAEPPDLQQGASASGSKEGAKRQYALRSPGGLALWFDDKARRIVLGDGEKNQLIIDAEAGSLSLKVARDLVLEGAGALTLKCGELSAQASQRGSVKAELGLALNSPAGIQLNDGALEVT
jgi:phage protein D/phage baseplate assembly protein gpV